MNTEVSANGLTAVAPKLLSGKIWVAMFPTSKSLEALSSPFRENIKAFINALKRAGATVSVSATLRPPQRAYLMHFSFLIAHSKQDPRNVPSMNDVNIEWFHGNIEDSIKAAKEMVNAYGIATTKTPPALMSNHISGNAIDMTISEFNGKEIAKQDGAFITVNVFNDLRTIGASYNVFNKIADDLPHWSTTGK
ncbi:hypothetical protein [Spirosoma linguale]|uniref:Uncharacterized protein n=1 Tax=Spirosoma linguale (strain ATCC 33905 / DSM 74 / LMG 10896 / Claus 1) TaxID=504472 RepID=D2QI72_SPILD|nr:hypothetical protein Slin_0906 [Spirosoma linguale DSM 74]